MGIMRRRDVLLSFAVLSVFAVLPVMATVTTEQLTDPEYVMNQGYSQLMAEDVYMTKNRDTGKPAEPLYSKNQNVLVRGWKAFWGYIDSANDEFDRIHHDIKPSPSYSDL